MLDARAGFRLAGMTPSIERSIDEYPDRIFGEKKKTRLGKAARNKK